MPVSSSRGMADPRRPNARLVPAPGDELCVAFANTLAWRGSARGSETLNRLGDLLAWCNQAGSIDARGKAELAAWGERHAGEAARLFDEAIAARETIYGLLSAKAGGRVVSDRDIDALNRLLAAAPA